MIGFNVGQVTYLKVALILFCKPTNNSMGNKLNRTVHYRETVYQRLMQACLVYKISKQTSFKKNAI